MTVSVAEFGAACLAGVGPESRGIECGVIEFSLAYLEEDEIEEEEREVQVALSLVWFRPK